MKLTYCSEPFHLYCFGGLGQVFHYSDNKQLLGFDGSSSVQEKKYEKGRANFL